MENDNSVVEQPTESAAQQQTQQIQGIEVLNRLLSTLRDAEPDAARGAWMSIQDPDIMTALAHAWQEDEPTVTVLMATIESVRGHASRARNLRAAVRGLAETIARRNTEQVIDDLEEELGGMRNLAESFGPGAPPPSVVPADILSQLCVPRGYLVDATGVYRVTASLDGDLDRTRIAAAPIIIAGRTVDVLTGEAKRQVVWRGPAGWCARVVSRRTLLDSARLIALSDLEAPVCSMNLATVVGYLAEFEAENGHRLPSVSSTPRMGWQPGGGFLLPEQYFASDEDTDTNLVLTPPSGLDHMAKGWSPQGTWEQWLEAVSLVSPFPHMYTAIYASVAAPLMKLLKLPGFVVDFSGETSGGKTTALRFAASVWGRPSENFPTAMYSWDSTKVWIERTAGYLHNLPLILDETKRAKSMRTVRDVIYDFCQGQGRGRGAIDGTRYTDSWCSVLISSGEGAATSFSQDAGTRARVLTLKGKPLGQDPEVGGRISEDVQMILADNHGHLGRRVAQYLVANRARHSEIQAVFREARGKYASISKTAVARRHAAHLAVLEVAAAIAHQLGVPEPEVDPFGYLMECQEAAGFDADRPLAALQDFLSWCAANQTRFHGRHESDGRGGLRAPMKGWAGKWERGDNWEYIAATTLTVKDVLEELGHNPEEIISRWHERKWLYVGRDRKRTRSRAFRIEGAIIRCYCIARAAADDVLGDEA